MYFREYYGYKRKDNVIETIKNGTTINLMVIRIVLSRTGLIHFRDFEFIIGSETKCLTAGSFFVSQLEIQNAVKK